MTSNIPSNPLLYIPHGAPLHPKSRDCVYCEVDRLTAERATFAEAHAGASKAQAEMAALLIERTAERDRLQEALRDYGQHQQKSCLDLPATETQFCYCGLTAALAGAPAEPDARQLLQTAYDMWAPSLATHPAETNGGWWLRETRRVLGIPEPARIDP